jgi:hypothetical protein
VPGLHGLLAQYDVADLQLAGWDTAALDKLAAEFLQVTQTPTGKPGDEWTGMPEFDQQDKTAFRILIVHFKTQADFDQFVQLTAARVTDKTKYIWFPEIEIEHSQDKRYATEAET